MLLKSLGRVARPVRRGVAAPGNSLVAAGALEGPQGRFAVKVPALIETPEDVAPDPGRRLERCVGHPRRRRHIKPTFKDATTITRVDGRPAVAIEV